MRVQYCGCFCHYTDPTYETTDMSTRGAHPVYTELVNPEYVNVRL